jgi:signal transduction histidine kinase
LAVVPVRPLSALVLLVLLVVDVPAATAEPAKDEPLLVGAATDHYPYSYLDANDRITGFAVDLLDEVARVGGLNIRRITGRSADLNRRFFAGEFPVAQVYAYSPGREGPTGFSAPYLTLKGALFIRRNGPRIESLADLAGRSVIVGQGSVGEEFLKHSGVAVTLVPAESADASLELLAQGSHDAALTSRLTGMAIVARSGYRNVLPTGPPIDGLTVSLCFASHDVERLVQINEGLAILYRTGDYERIYSRWFARYEPTSFTAQEVAQYAAGAFFVVAVGAVWVSWHQRRLSTRVAQQARELRAMDAELAQGRRLRAVGEMVGGIAHEFNNLLTPIVLKVELLREERDADPLLQRELDVIAGAADRAATLTRRLLTFGRKDEHEPAHVLLSDIVAANVNLLLPTCDPRIALVVDVPKRMPALFQNPADLHQVVLNLLLNARDTLHDKLERDAATEARITVRVESPAPSNGRGPVDGQRLSVTDTGVGMSREVLERIFEPFFTTKEVGRGTGLGLATVWHLSQTCGGHVEVESTPGVGTTFRVDLPRQAPPDHSAARS